jgi:hypothetical protein
VYTLVMRPEDLLRWVESRRAAEQREKLEARQAGPDPSGAIRSALALVALTKRLHGWPVPEDPVTLQQDALARERWDRVRAYFGKP